MWGKMGHPAKIEKSRLNCIDIFGIFDYNHNLMNYYSISLTASIIAIFDG